MDSSSTPPPQPVMPTPPEPDEPATQPLEPPALPTVSGIAEPVDDTTASSQSVEQPAAAAIPEPEPISADDANTDQSFEIQHGDRPAIKPPVVKQLSPESAAELTPQEPQAIPGVALAPTIVNNDESTALAIQEQLTQPAQSIQPIDQPVQLSAQPSGLPDTPAVQTPSGPDSLSVDNQAIEPESTYFQTAPSVPAPSVPDVQSVQSQAQAIGPNQPMAAPQYDASQLAGQANDPVDMFADALPETSTPTFTSTPSLPGSQPVSSFATPAPVDQSLEFIDPNLHPNQPIAQAQAFNQPQYAAPQPQVAAYNGSPIGQTQAAQPQASRKKLFIILGAIAGVIILVVAGFIIKAQFFGNKVVVADVNEANDSLTAITDDIKDIQTSTTRLAATDDKDLIKKDYDNVKSKLEDANQQATSLQKSKTLKYTTVKDKFDAFNNSWQKYNSFMTGSLEDVNTLKPEIITINKKLNGLSQLQSGSVSKRVGSYENAISEGLSTIQKINLKTDSYKKIQTGYIDYLNATMVTCKKVAANTKTNGADCFFGTDKTFTDYNNTLQAAAQQASDQEFKLDPTSAITDLSTSLTSLIPALQK